MLRQYFNCNKRLEIFLTCFCNILCYVGYYLLYPIWTFIIHTAYIRITSIDGVPNDLCSKLLTKRHMRIMISSYLKIPDDNPVTKERQHLISNTCNIVTWHFTSSASHGAILYTITIIILTKTYLYMCGYQNLC